LRPHSTYRGVLFITSENSLENLLRKSDKTAMGTYRRSVILNFSNKQIDEEDIKTIYASIYQHYGNLLKDITEYIINQSDFLKEKYEEYRKQAQQLYKFNGQENHFALLFCALHVLEEVLGEVFTDMTLTLSKIAEENSEYYQELTEISKEKLAQYIQTFIQENNSYFPTGLENNYVPQSIYGKVEGNTYYFTSLGLNALSQEMKIDLRSLKNLLIQFGMAETDGNRLLKKTTCSVSGKRLNVYKIQLYDGTEENQDTNQDDIAI
jgi:uncharacterized protein (DUF927 family)